MSVALSHLQQGRPAVPPLQNGDRLTRPEFERRYAAMPKLYKAELIEGIVYMSPPPVSDAFHSAPHFDLIGWLSAYRVATPGVKGGDNGSLRLDLENEPQPDAYLRIATALGQSKVDAEGYVDGAPELVAEIAASSASYDLHAKLSAYREHGVLEYIVWRVYNDAIDWMVLREGKYEPLTRIDGIYHSIVFPGLWLDPDAMIRGEVAVVHQVLQKGLAAPEHKAFLVRLQKPT